MGLFPALALCAICLVTLNLLLEELSPNKQENSPNFTNLFFSFFSHQAVDEVNRGNIRADGRLYELKALQDAKRASEYLALARTLPGYGDVVFPHCSCDSRKEGHVVPIVGK